MAALRYQRACLLLETGAAADTTLTTRATQDTTIVTSDTTVNVDTVKKEGDKAVTKDTVKH